MAITAREYLKALPIIFLILAYGWIKTMRDRSCIHIFGEVLFDHFPDGSRVLGGAPFNVAWHLQAFGQSPNFISRIGSDAPGQEVTALMDTWGMSRDNLQTDPEHPTGNVQVLIHDGEPHYEIASDSAYDFIATDSLRPEMTKGILYHGSLAVRQPVSHGALQAVKARHKGKIFIDANLRPPWWQTETLLPLLANVDWIKLNQAELTALCPGQVGLETTMLAFCEQYSVGTLIVTRGEEGAIAYNYKGRQGFITVKPPISTVVVDTVGAGDAFAAVLLLGLSKNWPLTLTLERAQVFASALVGRRGATVSDSAFYHIFNEQWGLTSL
jgi:fructokinase